MSEPDVRSWARDVRQRGRPPLGPAVDLWWDARLRSGPSACAQPADDCQPGRDALRRLTRGGRQGAAGLDRGRQHADVPDDNRGAPAEGWRTGVDTHVLGTRDQIL